MNEMKDKITVTLPIEEYERLIEGTSIELEKIKRENEYLENKLKILCDEKVVLKDHRGLWSLSPWDSLYVHTTTDKLIKQIEDDYKEHDIRNYHIIGFKIRKK